MSLSDKINAIENCAPAIPSIAKEKVFVPLIPEKYANKIRLFSDEVEGFYTDDCVGFKEWESSFFGDDNWKLLILCEGDIIPREFYENHGEILVDELSFEDANGNNVKFALIEKAIEGDGIGYTFQLDDKECLEVIVDFVFCNISNDGGLSNEAIIKAISILGDCIYQRRMLTYWDIIYRLIIPIGKRDFIFFRDESKVLTSLIAAGAEVQYKGKTIKGVSDRFYAEHDFVSDGTGDTFIKFAWDEREYSFEGYYMGNYYGEEMQNILSRLFAITDTEFWEPYDAFEYIVKND